MMAAGVVLRADGGPGIGLGHVARALALGEAWRRAGWAVHVVGEAGAPDMAERLGRIAATRHAVAATAGSMDDADATAAIARAVEARILVADGAAFRAPWFARVASATRATTVQLDDGDAAASLGADVVLNPAADAAADAYRGRAGDARLLLGLPYAPVREEVVRARDAAQPAGRLLLTLGGADPDDATRGGLAQLAPVAAEGGLALTALVGRANPAASDVAATATRLGAEAIVAPPDTAAVLAGTRVAVAAMGVTVLELLCLGVPTIVLWRDAAGQREAAALLRDGLVLAAAPVAAARDGALAPLVRAVLADATGPAVAGARARAAVDGLGPRRVVEALAA
ncbi:MAG: hypothetical protein NW201_08415 [Gemmatimonadales bacterium]|nr:hypothetical protein [Gemmatimonadales bacterium]